MNYFFAFTGAGGFNIGMPLTKMAGIKNSHKYIEIFISGLVLSIALILLSNVSQSLLPQ